MRRTAQEAKQPVETVRPRKRSTKEKRPASLMPEDWIREAEKLLVDKSVDSVRVDALATLQGVTRGSFYHHFADRSDLLEKVLLAWKDRQTEQVIARYENKAVDAQKLIEELTELPFHGKAARMGGAIELAIRAWARRDDAARSIVKEVDNKRLGYMHYCFKRLGFDESGCRVRAFTLYSYMQSESVFGLPGTDADRIERRQFIAGLLTKRDPS